MRVGKLDAFFHIFHGKIFRLGTKTKGFSADVYGVGSKNHRTILYNPLIIQANLINNQCDKFRIGRLSFPCADGISK